MRTPWFERFVCAAMVLVAAFSPARAATITVNSTNDPAGFNAAITIGGLGGTVTLRDAVNAANNTAGSDDIVFDASLNGLTVGMQQGTLSVSSTLSIGAPAGMTVQVSRIAGGRLFTVAGGSSLTASNLVMANFSDGSGGAIYNSGSLVLNLCVLTNNSAGAGGAIYNDGVAHLEATTIRDCFVNQYGDGSGGGVYNNGTLTAGRCTFANNTKYLNSFTRGGGAIFNALNHVLNLTNCTFVANSAVNGLGGAIDNSGPLTLVACTIADNGSGVRQSVFNGSTTARNCISQDGWTGNGNIPSGSAGLGTFGDHGGPTYTYSLLPSAPAIGAGVSDPAVLTDQRGVARHDPPDSGAYEVTPRATLRVSTVVDEDDGNTDPSQGTGTSLREALNYAMSLGGTQNIEFATSFAFGSVFALQSPLPAITNHVRINGLGADWLAVSGANTFRVFYVAPAASLTITGLTIANGFLDEPDFVSGSGAGIRNDGTLTLSACIFKNNRAGGFFRGQGGAIYQHGTALNMMGCTIVSNSAFTGGYGGGIHADAGTVNIANSTISANTANSAPGGGIACWFVETTISNSSISGNAGLNGGGVYQNGGVLRIATSSIYHNQSVSNGYGGGLQADSGTTTIDRSTFAYNVCSNGNGGAIANLGATLSATNCTMAFNSADNGGAIIHYGSPLTLVHCTVLYNSADYTGGGIERVGRTSNPFHLLNTLVAANNAPTGPDAYSYNDLDVGTFSSLGHNLIGDGTGTLGVTNGASGDIVGDASYEVPSYALSLGNSGGPTETIGLSPYSPAINGAITIAGLTTDQRGLARSNGGAPDIGAWEEPTGNGDYDGDTLSNSEEGIYRTSSLSLDSDNDGYNDPTEVMAGTDPSNIDNRPSSPYVARVFGYGTSRGLDLSGTFLYAFNVGTPGAAGTAGDAVFTADNVSGVTVSAPNEIAAWITPSFGGSADDDTLETVYQSIRWANYTNTLRVSLANLTAGSRYKLQLLFGEQGYAARVFDVLVNGTMIANDFRPYVAQGNRAPDTTCSAVVYEFFATNTTLNIVLDGENVPLDGGVDRNPILNGVTLELTGVIATNPATISTFNLYPDLGSDGSFTSVPNGVFTVYTATNVSAPAGAWSNAGPAFESPAGSGEFFFELLPITNGQQRFFRVQSP